MLRASFNNCQDFSFNDFVDERYIIFSNWIFVHNFWAIALNKNRIKILQTRFNDLQFRRFSFRIRNKSYSFLPTPKKSPKNSDKKHLCSKKKNNI